MTTIITDRRALKRTREACESAYPGRTSLQSVTIHGHVAICLAGVPEDGWQQPTLRRLRQIACGSAC